MDVNIYSVNSVPHYQYKNKTQCDQKWQKGACRLILAISSQWRCEIFDRGVSQKSGSKFKNTPAVLKAFERRECVLGIMYEHIILPYSLMEYIIYQSHAMIPP